MSGLHDNCLRTKKHVKGGDQLISPFALLLKIHTSPLAMSLFICLCMLFMCMRSGAPCPKPLSMCRQGRCCACPLLSMRHCAAVEDSCTSMSNFARCFHIVYLFDLRRLALLAGLDAAIDNKLCAASTAVMLSSPLHKCDVQAVKLHFEPARPCSRAYARADMHVSFQNTQPCNVQV